MSYFEELWSAGREEDLSKNIPAPNSEHDIFAILNNANSNMSNNLHEEVFFTPPKHEELFEYNPQNTPLDSREQLSTIATPNNEEFEDITIGGKLKVLGIGGAGCNAVNRMIEDQVKGVEFIAINTDVQVLKKSFSHKRVPIGTKITKGLGAGAKPEIGEKAALESAEEIRSITRDADMVFITAGMGGGTGTGATPIIAQVAKECGCLVVAVVTIPFAFEGAKRQKAALEGIDKLRTHVDTLLVISNSRIFEVIEKNTSVKDAFKKIDEVLKQAVQGIAGIISETAIINVDFNDVKTILANRGEAIMGIGQAKGEGRAIRAAEEALANPLIENNDFRQSGAMVAKIIGGSDFDMNEFHDAAAAISQFCRPDAEIIIGLDFDDELQDQVRIIIVATDLSRELPTLNQSNSASRFFDPIEEMQLMQQNHQQQIQHSYQNAQQVSNTNLYQDLPLEKTNYLDNDEDWGLRSMPKPKAPISNERRSIEFSVKKDHHLYEEFEQEARRSIDGIPTMSSDFDTPAFLRRRKKIQNENSKY